MSIEPENVLIAGYNIGNGENKPIGSLSLNFTKITYSIKPIAAPTNFKSGKDKAVWNSAVK